MLIEILSAIAAVIAVIFIIRKKDDNKVEHEGEKALLPIIGRQFKPDMSKECCKQAIECAGKIYKLDDLPRMPLPKCDHSSTCNCQLIPMRDRRGAERRSGKERRPEIRLDSVPRRTGKDRRKDCQDPFNETFQR